MLDDTSLGTNLWLGEVPVLLAARQKPQVEEVQTVDAEGIDQNFAEMLEVWLSTELAT